MLVYFVITISLQSILPHIYNFYAYSNFHLGDISSKEKVFVVFLQIECGPETIFDFRLYLYKSPDAVWIRRNRIIAYFSTIEKKEGEWEGKVGRWLVRIIEGKTLKVCL